MIKMLSTFLMNFLRYWKKSLSKPFGLAILFFVLCFSVAAQTQKIDSLKNILSETSDPNIQLNVLLSLCHEKFSLSSDSLFKYAAAAKALANRLQSKPNVLLAEYYMAYTLLAKSKEDSVIKLVDAQLKTLKYEGETREVYAKYCILKGNALVRSNKSTQALDVFYGILKEAEKQNDISVIVESESGVSNVFSTITQYHEALNWNEKAIQLCALLPTADYDELYAYCLIRQGIAYLHIYEGNQQKKFSDSSMFYAAKGMAICKKREILFLLCQSYILTGYNLSYSQKPKEAEAFLKLGLEVRKKIADPIYIISDMSVLGTFYAKTGQPEKGIAICKEGIAVFKQNKLSAQLLVLLNNALAQNYKAAGDYLNYSEILAQQIALKDSIYKKNSAEDLSALQTKYDVQKKENTIIQQQLDLAHKNNWITASFALLCITLAGGYFFFHYRRKKQLLEMQQLEIEEKRKTMHAIIHAEENERQRISSILHDSVAQKMVVTKLNLEAFEDDFIGMSENQQKTYENIYSLVNESFGEVRNLSHTMMPKEFYESGLKDAIKSFIDKIDRRKLNIDLQMEGHFERVDTNLGFMIYRIIQECVQNTIKHAKATTLSIDLKAIHQKIIVEIKDNGVGFDTEKISNSDSIGIKTMLSRIDYLKGEITIESKPANGTHIKFQIPIID